MKKRTKAIIAFVLMLVLIVSSVGVIQAAEGSTNLSYEVDKTEVAPGDTITVTISNGDMVVKSWTGGLNFDNSKLTVESIAGMDYDPDDPELNDEATKKYFYTLIKAGKKTNEFVIPNVSTESEANASSTVGFGWTGTADATYFESDFAVITFSVKEGVTGDIVFSLFEDSDGTDGFKADPVDGTEKTVTVNASSTTVDVESVTITGTEVTGTGSNKSVTHSCADSDTVTLSATVLPTDATEPDVTWSSSDANIATVEAGVVTKVSTGSVTITAKAGDKTDTCTVTFSDHNLVKQAGTPAKCESTGTKDYWKCSVCDAEFMDKDGTTPKTASTNMTIPKLGHDWNDPTWKWETDYSKATATFTCKNDASHPHTETDNDPAQDGQEATCTQAGAIVYTATVTFNGQNYSNSTESVSTSKLAHDPDKHIEAKDATCTEDGNVEYWTCKTCDNKFSKASCSDDSIISGSVVIASEGHKANKVEAKAATCKEPGNSEYYECSVCHKFFTTAACTTEITDKTSVVIPVDTENGHKWGAWSTVTEPSEDAPGLKRHVCEYDSTHYEELPIPQLNHTHTLQHHDAIDPTCETDGNIEYWQCTKASCGMCFTTANPASDDEAITEASTVRSATGHDFEAEWTWNDDGTEVFVTFTCKNNNTHVIANQDASASISAITSKSQDSTCTVAGYDTYKASYTLSAIQTKNVEKTFDSTEKKVDRPLAAHSGGIDTAFQDSTCTAEGHQAYTTCSVCQQRFSSPDMNGDPLTDADIKIDKKPHDIGDQIAVVPASCEATGTKAHYHCSNCEKNFEDSECTTEITDLTIPATKHNYKDAWEWSWADGDSEPTTKWNLICQNQNCTAENVVLTDTSNPKVTVTKVETESTDPTCLANGSYKYIATVTYSSDYASEATYTNNNTYTINKHAHTDNGSKTEAKAASCLEAGNYEYWTCSECGNYFSSSTLSDDSMYANKSDVIIAKEDHSMTETPAKVATCEEDGNIQYWTCSKCHFKYKDVQGNTRVGDTESVTIPATGHNYEAQWHWNFSDENKQYSATATLTCKNNSDHVVNITADKIALNIDNEQSVVPTCTSAGKLVVNGSFTYPDIAADDGTIDPSIDPGPLTYDHALHISVASHICRRYGLGFGKDLPIFFVQIKLRDDIYKLHVGLPVGVERSYIFPV